MEKQIIEILTRIDERQQKLESDIAEIKAEQSKVFELLVTVSDRVNEPVDNIEALASRMWQAEKAITKIQRNLF